MKTKDILKQAIKDFNGTVIVVSHDREFLDGLVEKVYEFGNGKVRECLGGIYEFLEKKKLASLAELELSKSPTAAAPAKPAPTPTPAAEKTANTPEPKQRLSYAEMKEQEKLLRKARKAVSDAEARITELEQEVAAIENKMAEGEFSEEIMMQHSALKKQLENAMSEWELASITLEQFEK